MGTLSSMVTLSTFISMLTLLNFVWPRWKCRTVGIVGIIGTSWHYTLVPGLSMARTTRLQYFEILHSTLEYFIVLWNTLLEYFDALCSTLEYFDVLVNTLRCLSMVQIESKKL